MFRFFKRHWLVPTALILALAIYLSVFIESWSARLESNYRRVQARMTCEEVTAILGDPKSKLPPGPRKPPGTEVWVWDDGATFIGIRLDTSTTRIVSTAHAQRHRNTLLGATRRWLGR